MPKTAFLARKNTYRIDSSKWSRATIDHLVDRYLAFNFIVWQDIALILKDGANFMLKAWYFNIETFIGVSRFLVQHLRDTKIDKNSFDIVDIVFTFLHRHLLL